MAEYYEPECVAGEEYLGPGVAWPSLDDRPRADAPPNAHEAFRARYLRWVEQQVHPPPPMSGPMRMIDGMMGRIVFGHVGAVPAVGEGTLLAATLSTVLRCDEEGRVLPDGEG